LAISINLTGFLGTDKTQSFFFDREVSSGNTFVADPLGFSVEGGPFMGLVSDENRVRAAMAITNHYLEDFKVILSVANVSGTLCPQLEMAAMSQENNSGLQDLPAFRHEAGLMSQTNGIWELTAGLKAGARDWQGKYCEFDMVVYGEQPDGGYSYQKSLRLAVLAAGEAAKEDRNKNNAVVAAGEGNFKIVSAATTIAGTSTEEISVDGGGKAEDGEPEVINEGAENAEAEPAEAAPAEVAEKLGEGATGENSSGIKAEENNSAVPAGPEPVPAPVAATDQ